MFINYRGLLVKEVFISWCKYKEKRQTIKEKQETINGKREII